MGDGPNAIGPLEQRTKSLDAFFELSQTPLALLDRDFRYIRVNQAFARASHMEADDFPGRHHFDLYPSDPRVLYEEARRSKQAIGGQTHSPESPDHPEWRATQWDWSLAPLLDESGEIETFVVSLQEVPAKGELESGWRRSSDWLDDKLIDRGRAVWVIVVAVVAEVALFVGVSEFDSPSRYLGIPGAAAALIAVVAAVLAGPVGGGVVALVGGVAFYVFLTEFGRTVILPTIVLSTVLWAAASVIAGLAADHVRRRAIAREAVLSQSARAREALVESLRASEEKYRALASENERLYRQQLNIAENLQTALLDIPSQIGPVRLGHLYRSASEAARVGGDFYDVFEVKEGKVAILMGDVSGHGIEAARTATLVKDVVHAFVHQSVRPGEVLQETNQLLIEKDLPGFVTAFLGILEGETGHFRYASAGHPEALLRRASGKVEKLVSRSLPLGVFTEAVWNVGDAELSADDRLVLYTDGVTEARRDGELFGDERLEKLVEGTTVSVEDLPARVLDEVLTFSRGALKDDLAVLALAMTGRLDAAPAW
jgi:serine phosphatase RsbU (regulator of sigma subunit)